MPARPSLNMVWSSASSTLISPLVSAFVFRSSSNTTRSVPLVLLERHCTVYTIWGQDLRLFDIVRDIPTTVRPARSSGIHRSAWKGYSPKLPCENKGKANEEEAHAPVARGADQLGRLHRPQPADGDEAKVRQLRREAARA